MSPNPYPVFSVSESDKPEDIQKRISLLIKLHAMQPDPMLAEAVVNHIVAILAKPGCISDIKQRCLFRQLEMHWRCLAWISNISTQKPKHNTEKLSLQLKREIDK